MAYADTVAIQAHSILMLRHTPILGNRLPDFYSFCMHQRRSRLIRTAWCVNWTFQASLDQLPAKSSQSIIRDVRRET